MATNDFIPFSVGGSANVITQSAYAALTSLTQNGFQSGLAQSNQLNKVWRQSSIMAAVLGQFIANTTGQNATDDGTTATLLANLIAAVSANSEATIGSARNLVMSITTASASATLTADEIIVGSALGGLKYTLPSFSKTINLATTGAGGMDTGTAPVAGYVALYAIYNPTTQTAALLATNATSVVAPNVYGGGNMPAGYTASALVSVWPTNASGQFVMGYQQDREISILGVSVLSTSTVSSTPLALNVSSVIPKNARLVTGTMGSYNSNATLNSAITLFSSSGGAGGVTANADTVLGTQCQYTAPIETLQTLYWSSVSSGGTPLYTITISRYTV